MTESKDGSTGGSAMPFIIGSIVGAGIALLLAPAKGEETRGRVSSWLSEGSRKTREYLSEGREAFAKKKEQVGSAFDAGKRGYQEPKNDDKSELRKQHDKFASIG